MKRYDIEGCSGFCEATIEEFFEGEYVKHDEAHALLKEAYEAIVENHRTYEGDRYEECVHCLNGGIEIKHDNDCIVNKAKQYLN
ncbi:MAG: hypothetical protein GY928_08065 [Colwellia sp.]|nr:hypothetical protein [Colwellia sp.]